MILKSGVGLTWSASAIPGESDRPRPPTNRRPQPWGMPADLFQGKGGCSVLLACDVPEVVDPIVQEVLDKCQDRELLAIRPNPASRVLIGLERLDPGNETLCSSFQLVSHHLRILLAVVLCDGCLVLVPVGKGRCVLAEHLDETSIEKAVHIADMGAILQRRPNVGPRACRNRRT